MCQQLERVHLDNIDKLRGDAAWKADTGEKIENLSKHVTNKLRDLAIKPFLIQRSRSHLAALVSSAKDSGQLAQTLHGLSSQEELTTFRLIL